MRLPQISVKLENAPGRLLEVTQALADAGVNLRVLTLADTAESGVMRLLVGDIAAARRVLMEMQLPASVDEVVAFAVADRPGSLAELLRPLFDAGINIEYMYAFSSGASGQAAMIFRFSDNRRAVEILGQSGAELTTIEELRCGEETP